MNYILASASPRRKGLLIQAGFDFSVIPSTCDETITSSIPSEAVTNLAAKKAEDVFEKIKKKYSCKCSTELPKEFTIIGADTVVVYQDEILGKPSDETEAFDMLSMLADRTHQVYTGVCLITCTNGNKHVKTFFERTDVTLYPICRNDLSAYIATGDSLDKAGGYGIQGRFAIHIKCIQGDYNNVVGLPIARLYHEL